jgi:hypothetical protein
MFLSLIFPNAEVNPDNGATVSKLEISLCAKVEMYEDRHAGITAVPARLFACKFCHH